MSEFGDTLQYFEAGQKWSSSQKTRPKKVPPRVSRTESSSSLLNVKPSPRGLNPSALFTVVAMATAPVGTTVIEDENTEDEEAENVMMTELSAKRDEVSRQPGDDDYDDLVLDFDLCEDCSKKRKAKLIQQKRIPNIATTKASSPAATLTEINQEGCSVPKNTMVVSRKFDRESIKRPSRVPPPRPPRSKVPSAAKTISNSSLQVLNPAPSTSAFTITPNPIISAAASVAASEETEDYSPPSEEQLSLTPKEVSILQKRVQLRRILPCVHFEELEEDRLSSRDTDESAAARLDLVDSRLADAHRGVMARTDNKYLVLEAATFRDKLFTGALILLTVMGILVLFWYRNFGPGFHILQFVQHQQVDSDHL